MPKISELPNAGTLSGEETLILVQSGVTKSLSLNALNRGEQIFNAIVQTTTNTPTLILSTTVLVNQIYTFEVKGSATETSTGDTFGFTLTGCIKNKLGITSLVGETYAIEFKDVGTASWEINAIANDTTDVLEIQVTGEAARIIDWNVTTKFIGV